MTYSDDVRVLFNQRCTTCHRPVSPIQVDIQNPFALEVGLVNSTNSWEEAYGETDPLDARNVVPFDPDASFLLDKLTGNLPMNGHGGARMPLQVPRVTPEEVAAIEQWITDGATPGTFFDQQIQPIFGSEDTRGFFSGKCVFCHYAGSPNPLDLTDPFGEDGLVNVPASYLGDTVRVLPGQPEQSLLVLKVRAERPAADIGAQMPYSFDNLTDRQVDTVRQWIAEGARP